jgi:hypothetical protein
VVLDIIRVRLLPSLPASESKSTLKLINSPSCLHSYRLPLELVSSVFDLVFAEGVEALFRFAVALLKRNEAYLLTLEFEELIDFLKNGLFEAYAVRRFLSMSLSIMCMGS